MDGIQMSIEQNEFPKNNSGPRNSNLDLVRLLAMFMVYIVHLGQRHPVIGEWTSTGAKGVLLFFILSGFLGMRSADHCKKPGEYLKKRFFRIIPCYYTVLIISYLWDLLQYTVNWGWTAAVSGPCNPFRYLRYFLFLQVILPAQDYTLWCNRYALWTMSAFAVFYLLAYPLAKTVRRFWLSFALLLVFMIAEEPMLHGLQGMLDCMLPYVDGYYAYHTPLTMLVYFLFGTTLYRAIQEKKDFLYLGFLTVVLIFGPFTWYRFECIFTILVYIGVKAPGWIKNPWLEKWLAKASEGSFCFYLCHMVALSMLTYIMKRVAMPESAAIAVETAAVLVFTILVWRIGVPVVERLLSGVWKNTKTPIDSITSK